LTRYGATFRRDIGNVRAALRRLMAGKKALDANGLPGTDHAEAE
jgi:hypothetical protein